MSHPCPHHCPKPGGGGAAAVMVLGVIIIMAAIARPVVHAVSLVLEVAVVAAASVLGLAGIDGIAFLVLHAQRRQARNLHGPSQHAPIAQRGAQALAAPRRLAIEAPRPTLADLKALAAEHGYDVIRRNGEED